MDFKRKLDRLSGAGLAGPGRAPAKSAEPAPAVEAPAAPSAPPPGPAPQSAAPAPPVRNERAEKISRGLGALNPKNLAIPAGKPAGATPAPGAPAARGPGQLPAEPRMTEHGLLHVADRLFPAEHRHGHVPVASALAAEPRQVATLALDPVFEGVDLTRMLLVDTETTGLAGGAGTLPFLIGLGWFEGESLRLHQLFLRRPGEEGPMLRFLAERMRAASCLVSYNGKTFDWPLLRTRFVLNRMQAPPPPPHLDLLHVARRIFKYRGSGARLVQVEEEVIGHRRVGDVDGALIPELYFRFLRGGSGAALVPVIEHNANDLVLLAALLGKLAHGLQDGGDELDPRDRLGFADVAARAERIDRALALAQSAARASKGPLAAEAYALSAWLLRRRGQTREAAQALTHALEHADARRKPALHFSLAKLYEHSLRNVARALEHARHTASVEGQAEHKKRVARLERRLAGLPSMLFD